MITPLISLIGYDKASEIVKSANANNISIKKVLVIEKLFTNEEIEKLILSGKASEYDMRNIGIKNGMVTMVQDGLFKAIDGVTSISEIFRVAEDK